MSVLIRVVIVVTCYLLVLGSRGGNWDVRKIKRYFRVLHTQYAGGRKGSRVNTAQVSKCTQLMKDVLLKGLFRVS